MKLLVTIICSFMLFPAQLNAADAGPDLDGCNRLYHDGAFEEAIHCYERIGTSAELLFNIGNSYARLDQTGYAVLYYLRALCLAPGDPDLLGNLNQIRKENSLFSPEPGLDDQFFSLLTIHQWSYLSLAALLFYLFFLIYSLRRKKRLSGIIPATVAVLIISAVGCWGAWHHYAQWQRSVVVEKSRLLISPFENAEPVGSIEPGRLVVAGKNYREVVHVTDEQGRTGWLKEDHQVPIIEQDQ
ncbi:MAG: hypothetical protein P8X39_03120 [Desulfofustis sp.]